MILAWIIVGWLICAGASYFLLQRSWRWDFDLTRSDRFSFMLVGVSGGPVALISSVVIYMMDYPRARRDEVVAARYDR